MLNLRLCCVQAQLVVLSTQIDWSENVESALTTINGGDDMGPLQAVLTNVEATLNLLADTVLMEQPPLRRRKLEHLVRTNTAMPGFLRGLNQQEVFKS